MKYQIGIPQNEDDLQKLDDQAAQMGLVSFFCSGLLEEGMKPDPSLIESQEGEISQQVFFAQDIGLKISLTAFETESGKRRWMCQIQKNGRADVSGEACADSIPEGIGKALLDAQFICSDKPKSFVKGQDDLVVSHFREPLPEKLQAILESYSDEQLDVWGAFRISHGSGTRTKTWDRGNVTVMREFRWVSSENNWRKQNTIIGEKIIADDIWNYSVLPAQQREAAFYQLFFEVSNQIKI